MPNDITVSIWSISYNHEDYIEDCLNGLISQRTTFKFEVVIGDDKSTDSTRKIIEKLSKSHSNTIKPVYQERNIGVYSNSFESVYPKLNGKYIAICEGDDYWTDKHKLQKQVDFLEKNPEYAACYHRAMVVDEKNNLIKEDKWPAYKDITKEDLFYCKGEMITNTVMFRNEIPKEKFVAGITNYDTLLWHLIGEHGSAKFLEEVKPSAYRIHKGGSWSSTESKHRLFEAIKTYLVIAKNIRSQKKSEQPIRDKLHQLLHKHLYDALAAYNFKTYTLGLIEGLKRLEHFKAGFLLSHIKATVKRKRKLI